MFLVLTHCRFDVDAYISQMNNAYERSAEQGIEILVSVH